MKRLLFLILFFLLAIFVPQAFARGNSFVSIVNPVRGNDFWDQQGQYPQTAVLGQTDILKKYNLSATWLIRYDALKDKNILESLSGVLGDEKGLFLEITPTWTKDAGVNYHQSVSWHAAGSAFLTGYEREERKKLIDMAFVKFKEVFGYYPKSIGAWWVDSYSLEYMQEKYGILGNLIVADQYTTDNYQIWGQYWSTPYYPSRKDALNPAQNKSDKLPVVMMQWAARDPVNAYGKGVEESTLSVQANDYTDYHNLNTSYFSKLVDIYTIQPLNQFNQLVVGLENSYSWSKYKGEYENQIKVLADRSKNGQFSVATMEKFADWYQNNFPDISPPQVISANDPLGSSKKSVWFMNPYYRVGWFYNEQGSVIRDIRQYIDGEEEICYLKSCDQLNFATFATRVLDDVTYHTKWVIDEGKIFDFKVSKNQDNYLINYTNEGGKKREIVFLPRDLEVDGKISTIDGAILETISKNNQSLNAYVSKYIGEGKIDFSVPDKLVKSLVFIVFILFSIITPCYFIAEKLNKDEKLIKRMFLSVVIGLVLFTSSFYILSLFGLKIVIFIYPLTGLLFLFLKKNSLRKIFKDDFKFDVKLLPVVGVTIIGTVFQIIPVFKSGLKYDFGMGFWGPNTHDGVWHIALINQLLKSVPPENPIFAQNLLKNYHYLYDLLVAATSYVTKIDALDLVFRFYPVLFSLMLGIGSYYLCVYFVKDSRNKVLASLISLFLVYFGGSLGWIVEYIKQKSFGGESAFWANQAISFNLNPPFAVSLIIMIAIILLFCGQKLSWQVLAIIAFLSGTLIGFKAYAAVIVIGSLSITGIIALFVNRKPAVILTSIFSLILSGVYILMNGLGGTIFQYSPLWFVNSMIDAPDRVGWARLSLARYVALEKNDWPKLLGVETLGLLIFLTGNLNIRIVGLVKILRTNIFIASLALLSLLFPLFFIQSGTPWNTIQFLYYFIYLCAVFTGPVVVSVIGGKYRYIGMIGLLLVLASPINSWATAKGYITILPHAWISNPELSGLEFLSKQPDGTVLTYPYDKDLKSRILEPWPLFIYDSTAYVAAFSKKNVFVADEPQNQILLTDYKKRVVSSKDFFLNSDNQARKNFLDLNKIKYIYLPKYLNILMDESLLNLKTIFENEEVKIYQRT